MCPLTLLLPPPLCFLLHAPRVDVCIDVLMDGPCDCTCIDGHTFMCGECGATKTDFLLFNPKTSAGDIVVCVCARAGVCVCGYLHGFAAVICKLMIM